jgi:hypothetical protein
MDLRLTEFTLTLLPSSILTSWDALVLETTQNTINNVLCTATEETVMPKQVPSNLVYQLLLLQLLLLPFFIDLLLPYFNKRSVIIYNKSSNMKKNDLI